MGTEERHTCLLVSGIKKGISEGEERERARDKEIIKAVLHTEEEIGYKKELDSKQELKMLEVSLFFSEKRYKSNPS